MLMGLGFCVLGGCQAVPDQPNPVRIAADDYGRLFHASVDVLREYRFRIDRQDYRFGVVTTDPLDAPTIFEPWDSTNSTLKQVEQATLSHLRRTVTVSFDRAEDESDAADGADYELDVSVALQRKSVPVRRLSGKTRRNVFSTLSAVPYEWAKRGIPAVYWEDIGRDEELERRLLARIIAEAEAPPPAAP